MFRSRRRRDGGQGIGGVQQIMVVRATDPSPCPCRARPGSSRRGAFRSIRPGRRTSKIRVAEPALRVKVGEHLGVNSSACHRIDSPGTRMLQEQPAAGRRSCTGQRIRPHARFVCAAVRRIWSAHSTMTRPASNRRRARSRPRSPAVAVPLFSSALSGADIVLGHGDVAGPTPYHGARSGVINRGDHDGGEARLPSRR